ncbi:MAG: exodeoxyribonuclease VII large subunit [Acidimicrobiaceae bacterium]|nr:exodeoxyribonuclease VII large subunit [Acidimicrobiaceae bacterium]
MSSALDGHTYSVGGFSRLVKGTLEAGIGQVWIRGTIQKISVVGGHRYIELVERSEARGEIVAQLNVAIFSGSYAKIAREMAAKGLSQLSSDLEVRLFGRADFYQKRGTLSFVVEALDVESLVEKRFLEREKLRAKLIAEGIFSKNSSLRPSSVIEKIAVVTSSAGVVKEDFLRQLSGSSFRFLIQLFDVRTTGDSSANSLAKGITAAARGEFDLIVLLRGGGSSSELALFDNEQVVRAVVNSRIPLWCGIGHSTDRPLVTEVANATLDVPLDVGRAVVDWNNAFLDGLRLSLDRIATLATGTTQSCRADLSSKSRMLERSSKEFLFRERSALLRNDMFRSLLNRTISRFENDVAYASGDLITACRGIIHGHKLELQQSAMKAVSGFSLAARTRRIDLDARAAFGRRVTERLKRLDLELELAQARLGALDPTAVLQKGFVLIEDLSTKQRIRSAGELHKGDGFRAHFSDGSVVGRVEEVKSD